MAQLINVKARSACPLLGLEIEIQHGTVVCRRWIVDGWRALGSIWALMRANPDVGRKKNLANKSFQVWGDWRQVSIVSPQDGLLMARLGHRIDSHASFPIICDATSATCARVSNTCWMVWWLRPVVQPQGVWRLTLVVRTNLTTDKA